MKKKELKKIATKKQINMIAFIKKISNPLKSGGIMKNRDNIFKTAQLSVKRSFVNAMPYILNFLAIGFTLIFVAIVCFGAVMMFYAGIAKSL